MSDSKAYLIVDIGTGNVRVAVADQDGKVLHVERDNVRYEKDDRYLDALYFDPNLLWTQIIELAQRALRQLPGGVSIQAITASSQREGIVLLDKNGQSLMGLPNHDLRGREWESLIEDKHYVYNITGRYPSSLFSALKLIGIKNRRPEVWQECATFLSISDWAQFQLCGVAGYEHSQASETLLYHVAHKEWSKELCEIFGINESMLAPVQNSGTILGTLLPMYAEKLNLSPETRIIVGGADTQLAIKSTQPALDDIVIVSGTTTPIAKIVSNYIVDDQERTWTNRHIDKDSFILEANAGVTGLNYQRLKEIFYPNEGYEIMEKELAAVASSNCVASLGSLVAGEKTPLTKGGFIFDAPVSHQLTRACFVRSVLWDIACSIKENFDCLCEVTPYIKDYVWACGGGFQSTMLRQFIADLIGKRVFIRKGYQQSSVVGGALICMESLGDRKDIDMVIDVIFPRNHINHQPLFDEWKVVRSSFQQKVLEEEMI
jgi:autoinducer 2 (AI-2) kinase